MGFEVMKYYSTQRPVSPGTFPREGAGRIVNFDSKQFCEEIGRDAWGYIEYAEPLSAAQMDAYELTQGGMKKFWCVTTSVNDRGRVAANITNVIEAVCQPENSSTSTSRRDIYNDWFPSQEEAEEFVEEARRA